VHYAANPEAESKRLPDTEEMHVRTRELLKKIDLIRTLNVMYEQGRFTGKDGKKLTKKEYFTQMGLTLHVDLSDYDKDLSRSMSDSTKLEKHLKVFDDMKLKMIEIWNSK
jgi:hypothetical protein